MQTLHEYMMETKAVEYVIAVVFMIVFVVFWRILGKRNKVTSPCRDH